MAYLASDACTSHGVVLRAADGRFSAGVFRAGDGVDFGREPASPDAIEDRWDEIVG